MATFENPYGLYFPIILSSGAPVPPALEDSIDSSIRIILSWVYATRFFLYPFGSILEQLLSSPNSNKVIRLAEQFIIQAIRRWEPRIQLREANITRNEANDELVLTINALVIETQSIYNYTTQL